MKYGVFLRGFQGTVSLGAGSLPDSALCLMHYSLPIIDKGVAPDVQDESLRHRFGR